MRANATWLVLLRWVAVAGQLLTIGVARFGLQMPLPMKPLVAVVGFTAATNVLFSLWTHHQPQRPSTPDSSLPGRRVLATVMATVMATDLLALTTLLYFSGGTCNPFSVFYLVNLALGAMILSESWGWGLTGVAIAGMTLLLVAQADQPGLFETTQWLPWGASAQVTLGQLGQIVAVAACALVIVHFVSRVTHQLALTAAELRRIERVRSRSEKLEALGTLAGGAAHELSTPLSTIAVVANEMIRTLEGTDMPKSIREDVSLIRSEVDQCRTILQRMMGQAGRWMAEQYASLNLHELVAATLEGVKHADRVQLVLPPGARDVALSVPSESLAQALRGLVQNALDATTTHESVRLTASWDEQEIQLVVQDEGPGMPAKVLDRAGEPFYTTKQPGHGMGLGLFLTRSVIERLGGRLTLQSVLGQGVTADVRLPREPTK